MIILPMSHPYRLPQYSCYVDLLHTINMCS
uniref:Poxvirus L3/FP4 protein n=1 Tax=Podoviridae sp. ctZkC8 TaxID=2825259 RepID=A0A8S5UBJ8_9CAUD|nr:MAG TPA: Poxvirus L3/FP4 protein [Podoviridae sp. ctZkC8]